MLTFTYAWPLLNCKGFPLGEKGFNLFMEDISVNPKSYRLYEIILQYKETKPTVAYYNF